MAGMSDSRLAIICLSAIAFAALFVITAMLAGCQEGASSSLNESARAVIVKLRRKDEYDCYATIEFLTGDDKQNATTLIACPEGAANSTLNSTVEICYTRDNPTHAPLLTDPVALHPMQDQFLPEERHCAENSYAEAIKCRKVMIAVWSTVGGLVGLPIAVGAIVVLGAALIRFANFCRSFFQSVKKRQMIIPVTPDVDLEMT